MFISAIDLVDEAAAKLRMEITSKPTELDGIDRAVIKLEMEKLSLKKDTDKGSKERLQKIEDDLTTFKGKQKELNEQWEKEKSIMTKISSLKEEVKFLIWFNDLIKITWFKIFEQFLVLYSTFSGCSTCGGQP